MLAEYFPQFSDAAWMILSSIILLLGLVVHVVLRSALRRLIAKAERSSLRFDDIFLRSIRQPLLLLIWLAATFWLVELAEQNFDLEILSSDSPLPNLVVTLLLAWACIRFLKRLERLLIDPERMKKPMDQTTVSALGRLLRLIVSVLMLLIVMQSYGFSVSGILAFGGIGGIAVGFAAKDLLANFFGGLMIYLDRPFKVGDWIRSPDKQIEGTVENIGWRQTRIRTFDKRPLYVPNATFASISVENPSRMTNRRIYEYIGLRYQDADQVTRVIERVRAMLEAHPDIDTNQTLIVNLDRFGPSSLDFFIYTFTKTTNWIRFHEIKQDVMVKIMQIIDEQGAEIAYPTTTVHLHTDAQPFQPEPEMLKAAASP